MTVCTFDGCGDEQVAKGYCWKHYRRNLRHGSPTVTKREIGVAECNECGATGRKIVRGLCVPCYGKARWKMQKAKPKEYYQFSKAHNRAYADLNERQKQKRVVEFLVQNADFPYYQYTEYEMREDWVKLFQYEDYMVDIEKREIRMNNFGMKLPKYYHPEIFNVLVNGRSMVDLFNDKDELYKIVHRGLGIDYAHTAMGLLGMMKNWHGMGFANHFRPVVAKWFYLNYGGKRTLDYSAGYGSRMLGAFAAGLEYTGIDPNVDVWKGNRAIAAFIERKPTIYVDGAENIMPQLEYDCVDSIFSCPPYFTKEIYSNDSSQSVVKWPSYDIWLCTFIGGIIRESRRILRKGNYFGMVISNVMEYPLVDDVRELLKGYFGDIVEWEILGTRRATSKRGDGAAVKHKREVMFVAR